MALSFRSTKPEDCAELVRFLAAAFQSAPDAPFLNKRLIEWKYFHSHPAWQGPRSYILEDQGRIVAHGCVYPVPMAGISAIRVIDWAGSNAVPGSGILLMRKLAALADVVLAPGGSEDTRAVLPKAGFREAGRLEKFAAVVRPLRHLLTDPRRDWKTPARFAANLLRAGVPAADATWSAEPVRSFQGLPGADAPRLDYMLMCPGAEFAGYAIRRTAAPSGWFLLAHVLGQARIAALRNDDDPVAGWSVAIRTAATDPRTVEVMTAASTGRDAILAAGLRSRGSDPIFAYDPKRVLNEVNLQLIDGDECFLSNPADPYT